MNFAVTTRFRAFGTSLLIVGMACFASFAVRGDDDPPENKLRKFMRPKLEHAKQVLEGLALEDFDAIVQGAQQLSLLSREASWDVLQTPQYQLHSTDFRRAADALTEAAREKNLDGATLAFMQVTQRCVDCHKYMRRIEGADASAPGLRGGHLTRDVP